MDEYISKKEAIIAVTDDGCTANVVGVLYHLPAADVAPMEEVFHEVDMFRKELMNTFVELCRGNDYNKLTLLKIGDTVDEIYANRISELKKKYTGGK